MTTPGWEGIFSEGEEILWQGRPDGKVVLRPRNVAGLIFGLFFAAFALFWMAMAAQAGGFFWMFGLLHFAVGIGIAFSALFWGAYLRRNTWYTLTNQNAYIAAELPLIGKRLKSWPITKNTALEFDDGEPASIWFAAKIKRSKNGSYRVPVGFERIEDGRKVYALFRQVQKNAA